MTTWRHTEAEAKGIVFPGDVPGGCIRCLWDDAPEPRHTPTPDPASPCGYVYEWGPSLPCKAASTSTRHDKRVGSRWHHPHVPTRCTCGHQLEAVNAR